MGNSPFLLSDDDELQRSEAPTTCEGAGSAGASWKVGVPQQRRNGALNLRTVLRLWG